MPVSGTIIQNSGAYWSNREPKTLLGIEVDVLTPNALSESFRHRVLSEAKRI
ncbi:MAG: DNA polymerase III subunit beta [Oxalobacteraceae bacterium]|nr:DNA polymerase III subunit beta [Oxalobacteraceae bacterium]